MKASLKRLVGVLSFARSETCTAALGQSASVDDVEARSHRSRRFGVLQGILTLALLHGPARVLHAAPWAIVTDFGDATIHTIDLGTSPPTVYGPFLRGEIVETSRAGAIKTIPGDRSALLAGAYANMWLLDISNPTQPRVTTFVGPNPQTFGLAVSQNGRFAVTVNQVLSAILDLRRLVLSGGSLPFPVFAASVAIAPNDSTVVITDSSSNRLFYGDVNSDLTGFVSLNTVDTVSAPLKVAIAPDGETVFVGANDVEVYRLTGNVLTRGTPPVLSVGAQSFAFEPNGNRVYALSWASSLSILRIEAPGLVTVEARNIVTIPTYISPPSSGIDMLAITPDGRRLIVGDSTGTRVHVVSLSDLGLSTIDTGGRYPTGIAVFQGIPPEPTATPTIPPTPTATPTAIAQSIPLLSSGALTVLALILAALGLSLLRRL